MPTLARHEFFWIVSSRADDHCKNKGLPFWSVTHTPQDENDLHRHSGSFLGES